MKTPPPTSRNSAFTLVMVLTILASVTILVVGLFSIVSSERQISASFDAVEQADLAIQAGLARASAMLDQSLRDETSIIFAVPSNVPLDEPRTPIPVLLSATYDWAAEKSDTPQWHYQPLVSGSLPPDASLLLQKPPAASGALGYEPIAVIRHEEADRKALRRHPGAYPSQAPPIVWWETLSQPVIQSTPEGGEEEIEKIAARFCFHIEDLQGLLNLSHAGNLDSADERHERHSFAINGAHVVPGLNLAFTDRPLLNQSALYSLFDSAALQDTSDLGRHLIKSRKLLFTPDAWKEMVIQPDPLTGWPGRDASSYLARDANSSRYNEASASALEEHSISGLTAYDELALIPPDPAFVVNDRLQPNTRKLNLNRLLAAIEALPADQRQAKAQEAVTEIATHIQTHLPDFSGRRGGYPLGDDPAFAYLQCLAAGIIDYADTDSMPTMKVLNETDPMTMLGVYRGMDAFPVVSENWQRYKFESTYIQDGDRYINYSVTHFVELWNMANQRINGQVQTSFELNATLTASAGIYTVSGILDEEYGEDEARVIQSKPAKDNPEDTLWWHAPLNVDIRPNEYVVLKFDPVIMKLRAGPESTTNLPVEVRFAGADGGRDRKSRYRMRFRATIADRWMLVDFPNGPVDLFDRMVGFPESKSSPKRLMQEFNTHLPGMSYSDGNNTGTYANNVGDPRAAFFINYIVDNANYVDGSSPWSRNIRFNVSSRFFGENRINLWPDGGHNSPLRTARVSGESQNPDEASPRPQVEESMYVQRISNQGRLFSVTELGHVFDPLMWDPDGGASFAPPPPDDMKYRDFADIRPGNLAQPSIYYCGGNTLRIGRPEHSRFRPAYGEAIPNRPADRKLCATALLDIFHTGIPRSTDELVRTGDFQRVNGHVNINTASKPALQALVAGSLVMDSAIQYGGSADPVKPRPGTPESASLIADEIIQRRPFLSASELPERLLAQDGEPLLGHTYRKTDREVFPEWNDSAAEEAFARIFNSSTVRSRHFRIVVTGQCYRESRSGVMNVLASRSRIYHVFVRPVRGADGVITRNDVQITYARNL